MTKWWSVVYPAALLLCIVESAVILSDMEKQLEKFGTRVGKNEFVSIFKDPVSTDGSGNKPQKTFVLLSKLYTIPSSRSEELSAMLKLPADQLKLRTNFPTLITTTTTTTEKSNPDLVIMKDQQEDRILFREEATTRKSSLYNTNFQDRKSTHTVFRGWNLPTNAEVDSPAQNSNDNTAASLRRLLLYRLAQAKENSKKNSTSATKRNNDDPNIGNEMTSKSQEEEDLSWYTLITVPGRARKSGSDGCPTGQRKDHHGICRSVFVFGTSDTNSNGDGINS